MPAVPFVKQRLPQFLLLATGLYACLFLLIQNHPMPAIRMAVLLDLTLTIPALFYLFVARPLGWGIITAVPLLVLGLRLSPVSHAGWLALPLEGILVVAAARKLRNMPASSDVLAHLRSLTETLFRNRLIANLVAAELAIFYYAFNPKPRRLAGALAYPRNSSANQFAPLLLFVLAAETAALHLILVRYSPIAAWTVTALDVYALIFVTAFWRSSRSRTHTVQGTTLTLRLGLLRELTINAQDVAGVIAPGPLGDAAGFCFGDPPQLSIDLKTPATATNLYGFERQVTRIVVAGDAVPELQSWLAIAKNR